MQVKGAMGEHHSLRRACAAAGVEELSDGVFVVGENIGASGLSSGEQRLIVIIERDELLNERAGRMQGFHQGREIIFEHQKARLGMIEDSNQLRRSEADIQGHHYAARLNDAEVAFQELVVIEAEIGDSLAWLYPFGDERRGQPFTPLAKLAIGESALSAYHSNLVRIQIDGPVHASNGRQRYDHELSRETECVVYMKNGEAIIE